MDLGDYFNYIIFIRLPLLHADLGCVGVTVQLPLSVLHDNLTLRCIHFFFDPYSHLAKSYELPGDQGNTPICGIMNIEDSAASEWAAQVDIQEELMLKMSNQMQVYQDAMESVETIIFRLIIILYLIIFSRVIEAEKTKIAENKEMRLENKPPSKLPKKPQELPEGKVPDPYKIFIDREEQECKDFFMETFNPRNINLLPFEVGRSPIYIMIKFF